jgi:nitrogen fixation NifU-like protein
MLSLVNRTVARTVVSRAGAPAFLQTARRSYHENIVEHYENPRNVGSLDKNDESVGTVSRRSALDDRI